MFKSETLDVDKRVSRPRVEQTISDVVQAFMIIQKHRPRGRQGMIDAMNELSDHDLEDYLDDLK